MSEASFAFSFPLYFCLKLKVKYPIEACDWLDHFILQGKLSRVQGYCRTDVNLHMKLI